MPGHLSRVIEEHQRLLAANQAMERQLEEAREAKRNMERRVAEAQAQVDYLLSRRNNRNNQRD